MENLTIYDTQHGALTTPKEKLCQLVLPQLPQELLKVGSAPFQSWDDNMALFSGNQEVRDQAPDPVVVS